ncbi:MAG: laccase domain-containing protein [Deltaproteobacteria bacterium]|nr:laccase domain-containing protein [Deltaproteobacteria bacterium]MBW2050660.1 laccase domain-containing protein [Deltaproteobacteria bacterium]MBW2139578.1 laccase domain-containing protein [Deltaproteobacteria bacterium]MBW2322934.1 laccase domain-containing protein [Deltaproteobacteria bacterium]
MKLCQENGLVYYRFDLFENFPGLNHGITTRFGGVSPQGLNLSFGAHDLEVNVQANLDLASETIGFNRLFFAKQVHGDQSLVIKAGGCLGNERQGGAVNGYDALITSDRGLGLVVMLADCQGVALFDPVKEVVAVVHNGWRGSVANILGQTVSRLKTDFNVRPEDLMVGISPSLGPCCAEFVNYARELPQEFWKYQTRDHHFDFWSVSKDQLMAVGVRSENIEISGICTVCDDIFYSYRREKAASRFGLIAGLV